MKVWNGASSSTIWKPFACTSPASKNLIAPFALAKRATAPIAAYDPACIPAVIFTDPEIARVGLNETEAKERGIAYELTTYGIDDLDRAIADESAHGLVKVLTVPGKDKILGATIVGEHAGDLLAEYVMAMRHGIGLNKILGTIHTYPTLAEEDVQKLVEFILSS